MRRFLWGLLSVAIMVSSGLVVIVGCSWVYDAVPNPFGAIAVASVVAVIVFAECAILGGDW